MKNLPLAGLLLLLPGLCLAAPLELQSPATGVFRFVELSQMRGRVLFASHSQPSRPANRGDRLVKVRDRIQTLADSGALLRLDDGIGQVQVGPGTTLMVDELLQNPDGSKVTRIAVEGGQVLLKVRKLSHPRSRIEVKTPSGIAAVRGTVFGIAVAPSGTSTIATSEGEVAAAGARGAEVALIAGLQSRVVPGLAPEPPRPLVLEAHLSGTRVVQVGPDRCRVEATTGSGNLVVVEGETIEPDANGYFSTTVALGEDRRIRVVVTTALGQRREFVLNVLLDREPR